MSSRGVPKEREALLGVQRELREALGEVAEASRQHSESKQHLQAQVDPRDAQPASCNRAPFNS